MNLCVGLEDDVGGKGHLSTDVYLIFFGPPLTHILQFAVSSCILVREVIAKKQATQCRRVSSRPNQTQPRPKRPASRFTHDKKNRQTWIRILYKDNLVPKRFSSSLFFRRKISVKTSILYEAFEDMNIRYLSQKFDLNSRHLRTIA